MDSWSLGLHKHIFRFWIRSGFFRIIFVQHWNQGSPGQILSWKNHRFIFVFVLFCLSKLIRERRTSKTESPTRSCSWKSVPFCWRLLSLSFWICLLRVRCLCLTFLCICFHCSDCSSSCVVLACSTCVVCCLFSCVSFSLSVVSRFCWLWGCVAFQCPGTRF